MKNKNVKDEKKEKKIGLTTKIFIALLLGAVFGIVLCYLIPDSKVKNDIIVEGILYVIGQGFIRPLCAEVWQSEIRRSSEQ